MGGVLGRALGRIRRTRRVGGNDNGGDSARSSPGGSGGLSGLCRAVFQHSAEAIGFVDPGRDGKGSDSFAVSR